MCIAIGLQVMPAGMWSNLRLPEFHGRPGESWERYEDDIQLVYDGAGKAPEEDATKRAHLLIGLKSEASNYLDCNPHLRRVPYTEALDILRKRFTTPEWKKIGELQFRKQEPDETVRGYVEKLKTIVYTLNPVRQFHQVTKKEADKTAEDLLVEQLTEAQLDDRRRAYEEPLNKLVFLYFMQGLRPNLREKVWNALPQTLDEAVAIAERQEESARLHADPPGRVNLTVTELNGADPTVQRAEQQLKALNNNDTTKQDRTVQTKGPVPDFRCYNCNRRGHYARDCTVRRFQAPRHPMERDGAQVRRQMQSLSGKAAPHKWTHGNDQGKQRNDQAGRRRNPRFYDASDENPRPKMEKGGQGNKKKEGRSTWLQNEQAKGPKNGMRPPQRGGLVQLPQPRRAYQ